ncbi:MAG: hypothetical protein AAGD25_06255 [Cyanobacteria bacterium P01_F01_bin.150]
MSEERANAFSDIRPGHGEAKQSNKAQVSLPAFLETSARSSLNLSGASPQPVRKRGRPATGKRSDPNWIGRTYYVKRATDLEVEGVLFKLKCQGIEIDKSELVNSLLGAWVSWQQSDSTPFPANKVLPHQ